MSYIGDIALGSTIDLKFTTVSTTGVPTTLAGTPAMSAYPDNSTTEITAGITLTVDFDGRTGMHNVRIVATSGNGYAAGSNYDVVITTGTVGGSSVVGYVVGSFSIEARSAIRPTTAGRTITVDASGNASILSGIKKNVALAKFEFLMTDSTNHNPATGKTVTVTRSIDNGAFAAGTLSAVTEIAFGIYSVDFAAGDLNGTVITLRATATACDDLDVTIVPDP